MDGVNFILGFENTLISPVRDEDGSVPLGYLLWIQRWINGVKSSWRWSEENQIPDIMLNHEKQTEWVYNLAQEVHRDDCRKQINPLNGKNFGFGEHFTGTAYLLLLAGYGDPVVIQGALGHDIVDMHNNLFGRNNVPNVSKEVQGIIDTTACLDDLFWGGEARNKTEQKRNQMLSRLANVIKNYKAIPVSLADRVHNLLSFSEYDLQTRKGNC